MRNFSKENLRTYYREGTGVRAVTGEKAGGGGLKEDEVRVGKYKYDVKEELGKGFSSNVYKGVELLKPHKRYAIKVINLRKFRGANLEMLQAEIEIHQSLDHDHIVKLHEVIKTSHHYYLVMEYCPHGNLNEFIAHKKQLSETNALDIITQLANAYRFLLASGVLHRDIKPANVLRVGNKWKLSDFGFATRTRFGFKDRMNVGTPLYMAPESLKRNLYSYKSDLYSLGIVLYEMIAGKTPHEADTEKELMEKINSEIVLPKNIKHPKIIEFLTKVCQVSEPRRMTREEFQHFDFGPTYAQSSATQSIAHSSSTLSLKDRKFSGTTDDSVSKQAADSFLKSGGQLSSCKQISFYGQQIRPNKNPMIANKELLSLQLEYTHHFYYTIQNIDSFHLQDSTRSMFMLALFKLLLKIMRLLCDRGQNHFQLQHWEEYQHCKLHQQLTSEFTFYSEKYEKEYLEFIKHNDIKVIRAVNRKFPELCHSAPLNTKFYENFKLFMAAVIREHSKEVSQLANSGEEQLNDRFEALESAYAIYRLAEVRSTVPTTAPSEKLNLIQDYTISKRSKSDYMILKRALKNL